MLVFWWLMGIVVVLSEVNSKHFATLGFMLPPPATAGSLNGSIHVVSTPTDNQQISLVWWFCRAVFQWLNLRGKLSQ